VILGGFGSLETGPLIGFRISYESSRDCVTTYQRLIKQTERGRWRHDHTNYPDAS
jgi:hypothetical protein